MTSKKFVLSLGILSAASACKSSSSGSKGSRAAPSPGIIVEDSNDGDQETPDSGNGDKPSGTSAGTVTKSVSISYPLADADLGEEIQEGELEAAKKIMDIIEKQIKAQYPAGKRALRDAHPKGHGCLKADFTVEPTIPAEYEHGVFKKGSTYKAVIRFSNSSENPAAPDIDKDGRGMAIKLMNVPGKKLLEADEDAGTQDFIMISHPTFFIKDPSDYVTFLDKFQNSDAKSRLETAGSLGIKGLQIATAIKSLQVASPIQTQYFSNVPYQLGLGDKKLAVKYNARPCEINGNDPIPTETKDPNYLRVALFDHFQKSDACMEIFVQKRTGDDMSVEDSRDEWKTPWTKIATLTMKKGDQELSKINDPTLPANKNCDTLSFNPWHSLPEHKPLGSVNRIRKVVYEHISKVRHELNKEERREP